MAVGDCYDCRGYTWQLRENTDGGVFVRYDNTISSGNKGRYNTSAVVRAEVVGDNLRVTTKSGSTYYFAKDKIAHPMHLVALSMRFGVEF